VLPDPSRPTTAKVRFMGRAQYRHPHQMLRVDREVRYAISAGFANQLLKAILPRLTDYSAVLISDYAKGVCTPELLRPLIDAAKHVGLPVVVDPASSANYHGYRGATGVTPNRSETFKATGCEVRTIADAFAAGNTLVERFDLDMAFVTLDRDGIVLARRDREPVHLPTRPREVCDITGAGDMVLAMIGVGMAAGIDAVDLCRLANVAGGLEVEQIGVVPISRKDILGDLLHGARRTGGKVCTLEELARQVSARRKAGQKIVLTNGCFDLLHVGHVSYLEEAAREGDCLIVALNSDASVRRLEKGPERPLFDQEYRARMLAGLEAVDYVVIFDEDTPHAVLHAIKPDVLVKGGTYREEEIVGREVVLEYGGRVKPLGVTTGVSTTEIVRRLRAAADAPTIPLTLPERKAA
jgi:D-beta-D-heptose 7-phosphate kinase/D-beta-D-heptose 1-phosphate adenosyltransferase